MKRTVVEHHDIFHSSSLYTESKKNNTTGSADTVILQKNLELCFFIISNYVFLLFSFFHISLLWWRLSFLGKTDIRYVLIHSDLFPFVFTYVHWSPTLTIYEMMLV